MTSSQRNKITAAVIDAAPLSREGLAAVLNREDVHVGLALAHSKDLVVPESELPNVLLVVARGDPETTLATLSDLRARYPAGRILVLGGLTDCRFVAQCFELPVDGLVSSDISGACLSRAFELISAGERYFSADLIGKLLKAGAQPPQKLPDKTNAETARMSGRERDILRHLAAGETNKAIARELDLTEATVKVHLKSILRKLNVRNRTQAAIWAINTADQGLRLPSGLTEPVATASYDDDAVH